MASHSGATRKTGSITTMPSQPLPKPQSSVSEHERNSMITGRLSSQPILQSIEKPQSQGPESPRKSELMPSKEEILSYKPQKQILHVDASVAAYFADMFQALKNQSKP
jgi:hypothetical protein